MFFREQVWPCFILLLFFYVKADAANPGDSLYNIDRVAISHTQILRGNNDHQSISEILKDPAADFTPLKTNGINLKPGSHNNWIKKSFINYDSVERDIIVEITNPFLYNVSFYSVDSSTVADNLATGASMPFSARQFIHPNLQYQVTLAPLQQRDCYIRIDPGTVSADVLLLVWDKDKRRDYQVTETKHLSYFLIINIVFLLLIGLAIFQTRLRYQWFYFFYVLFGIAHIYTDLGLGFKNLWPQFTSFNNAAIFIFANGYLVFGVSFVRKYFETLKRTKTLDFILQILVITGIVAGLLELAMIFSL